jgi:hypothetical protein
MEHMVELSMPVQWLVSLLEKAGFLMVANMDDSGGTIDNHATNCVWKSVVHSDTKVKRSRSYKPKFTADQYTQIWEVLYRLWTMSLDYWIVNWPEFLEGISPVSRARKDDQEEKMSECVVNT